MVHGIVSKNTLKYCFALGIFTLIAGLLPYSAKQFASFIYHNDIDIDFRIIRVVSIIILFNSIMLIIVYNSVHVVKLFFLEMKETYHTLLVLGLFVLTWYIIYLIYF